MRTQKPKLLISFSGGRTSAYMTWWMLNKWPLRNSYDIIVVFANTGKEVEETLIFVDECAMEWGIEIIWVEGYPSEKGKGWKVTAKQVTFETAARKGEPFEAMVARLGIPSSSAPFCSDQLKRKAIQAYLRTIGWKKYWKAIGIRADETIRVRHNWRQLRTMYPLVWFNPVDKPFVHAWWSEQRFDLLAHPDDGNCDRCWKKPFTLLYRAARRDPESYDWWKEMTRNYSHISPRNKKVKPPFNFYRGNVSPDQILEAANGNTPIEASDFVRDMNCSESCEAF